MPSLCTSAEPAPSDDRSSRIMARLCNLPRLSPQATRLLSVSMDVDAALAEFEDIFNSDPSLAAEILRYANSVEFGLRARVTNIRFALILLGVDRTRNLAFQIVMSRYPQRGLGRNETRAFWQHGMASAVLAEELGRMLHAHTPLAYTAGLTHDLGRLGLLMAERDSYREYLSKQFQSAAECHQLERMCFGFTHGEAGAYLAQTWHFPAILCGAIRMHHDPPAPGEDELARITQTACALASALGYPELPNCPGDPTDSPLALELGTRFDNDPDRLRQIVERRLANF